MFANVYASKKVEKVEKEVGRTGTIQYTSNAGWSSLVARWAHNPKVAGSNPAPATKAIIELRGIREGR